MSEGIRNRGLLIPLTADQLDLLEWFAAWTPAVHRAAWKRRRRWPPGYRQIADLTVTDQGAIAKAREELSASPERRGTSDDATLLSYGLLEGAPRCYRLTRRGRAALKLDGRECPDAFRSHCADIFDDVDLRPTLDSHFEKTDPHGRHFHTRRGARLEDNEETWREMLVEYNEDDYHAKGTLTGASAHLGSCSTGGIYLNGSLRKHRRYLALRIRNRDHRVVCEAAFSLEGLADLLTGLHEVPVTLESYYDQEGMRRGEPVPPPVSPMRRMRKRLKRGFETQEKRFEEIVSFVTSARMGKRAKVELLRMLVCRSDGEGAYAFAVQESVEEVGAAVESMLTIASERVALVGDAPVAVGAAVRGLIDVAADEE